MLKKRKASLSPSTFNHAILVHLHLGSAKDPEELIEFQELARAAGAHVVAIVNGTRQVPDAQYFIGTGKVQELQRQLQITPASVVLVNHNLTPSQQRNLETALKVNVVDRTALILDIFAQRARTFEGKLQVELAQLERLATRLVRGWTHLERQKGGIGLRGPGETQLETDRRLLKNRIKTIKQRLQKVVQQRAQSRRARQRADIPIVALVGYTNAGKSTLFNKLTDSAIFAENLLFATLDPTLRRAELPLFGPVIFADTVGFIRDLPHDLVAAFKATLEETRQAHLLLQVIDASQQHSTRYMQAVSAVLEQIGADTLPQLHVYNKIDLTAHPEPRLERNVAGLPDRVWISATTGAGMELLQQALVELLGQKMVSYQLELAPEQGKLRAELHDRNAVIAEEITPQGGWILTLRLVAGKKNYE